MSTEQEPPKGTRVEITDPEHPWVGDQGEIVSAWDDELWRIRVPTDEYAYAALRPDQFRVIEPTIGQLVDAMQAEIERICREKTWVVHAVDTLSWPFREIAAVYVAFDEIDRILTTGETPQAALRAMIERLKTL